MKSFIVPLFQRLFSALRWISLFSVIRAVVKRGTRTHGFVDAWVLAHLALSFVPVCVLDCGATWAGRALPIYGGLRVFEILVYQLNVLLFDPFSKRDYALGGYRRILLLTFANYLEIMAWFAGFYAAFRDLFNDPQHVLCSAIGAIYHSIVTMTTLGYGDVTPSSDLTRGLVIIHTLVGVFLVAVIVARILSFLPRPATLDEAEKRDVKLG